MSSLAYARAKQVLGRGLIIFSLVLLGACLLGPWWMAGQPGWGRSGALLYFLGLLTLVNAPFDWFALGITRGLLRKGLEKGGYWPLWFGLIDLLISILLIIVLAVVVLWATEIFNLMAQRGGAVTVPLNPAMQLADIKSSTMRGNPGNWWLYAMLFSTQIPALLNIMLGCFSAMRGWPWLNALILRKLDTAGPLDWQSKALIAGALSLQFALSIIAALALFFYGLYYLFIGPETWAGRWLLDGLIWLESQHVMAALL